MGGVNRESTPPWTAARHRRRRFTEEPEPESPDPEAGNSEEVEDSAATESDREGLERDSASSDQEAGATINLMA